jgi:hypothetical protein
MDQNYRICDVRPLILTLQRIQCLTFYPATLIARLLEDASTRDFTGFP